MSASKYETVVGLEVHVELHTNSKIFCGCSTAFGAPPNTHTCPVCLGHPGVLPVLNRQAVDYAMKAAIALNCTIADVSKFDRKTTFTLTHQKPIKSLNLISRSVRTAGLISK